MSASKIFLSRAGQTFGPVSESELRVLRESGRLLEYMWIWQSPDRGWEPLHAMPPAPQDSEARELRPEPVAVPAQPLRPARSIRPNPSLEAVLHDFHHLVTGKIESLTEQGCELNCEDHEAGPLFREKAPLVLNLLDTSTGQTMNVRAKLNQVSRHQGHWTYQLSWERLPEMLQ